MEYNKYAQISATIIKDCIYKDERVLTFQVEVPKFLLSQINTHRMLVKNFESSRSRPTKQLIEQPPYIPQRVGVNRAGMSAGEYLLGDDLLNFQHDWLKLRNMIADEVLNICEKHSVHKEIANRALESFMMVRGVLTANLSTWKHIIKLRKDGAAQPEFQELATLIEKHIESSNPTVLKHGDFYLPFVNIDDYDDIETALKVSASVIAQTSFRKSDYSLEKALNIFEKLNLYGDKPHISVCQHCFVVVDCNEISNELEDKLFNNKSKKYYAELCDKDDYFIQISKFIENDKVLVLPELLSYNIT